MTKRISIYIDGANFVYGLKSLNEKYSDYHFDFDSFFKKITGKNDLIDIFYYNASLKQAINPRRFKEQQRLLARLRKIAKCKVILCKRQKRFNKDDEEYYTIKGDDINLALDMLNDAWENKYNRAILISGDGDFIPLLKYVKEKGKEVEVISFKKIASYVLLDRSDRYWFITKKIANKLFWREKK
jgi:uncharacterized LabA/DUF88 family protein